MKSYETQMNNQPYYTTDKAVRCIRRDGIEIRVAIKDEQFPMGPDWLGSLSSEEGDIRIGESDQPQTWEDKECYFTPANSFKSRHDWYREHGYSRHESHTLALKEVMEDYHLLCEYYDGDRTEVGVIVSVGYKGVKLSEDSVWGVDCQMYTDKNQDHWEDTAFEVASEAVHAALKEAVQIGAVEATNALARLDGAYTRLARQRNNRRATFISRIQAWRAGKCPQCGGSGYVGYRAGQPREQKRVYVANKPGFISEGYHWADGPVPVRETCPQCEGKGK